MTKRIHAHEVLESYVGRTIKTYKGQSNKVISVARIPLWLAHYVRRAAPKYRLSGFSLRSTESLMRTKVNQRAVPWLPECFRWRGSIITSRGSR
jgi:hypothetical protein